MASLERRRIWQDEIDQRKLKAGCQWPGCKNVIEIPAQLEFAHVCPDDKEFDISQLLNYSPEVPGNRERLEAEIAKCKVLCLLHHRLETVQGRHYRYRRNKPAASDVLPAASPQLNRPAPASGA